MKQSLTTIPVSKELKDLINQFKYKYHIKNLDMAVQLLYNIRDEDKLNKEVVSNQLDTLDN